VLVTVADRYFSLCIRQRAGWKCERCGRQYLPGATSLHCSHFIGRGHWAVRFSPDNAACHCFGCHRFFEGNPLGFTSWIERRLGEEGLKNLAARAQDLSLSKRAHHEVKLIAAHYRKQYQQGTCEPYFGGGEEETIMFAPDAPPSE